MAAASASRRLRELQTQAGNRTCVDCSQRNPQWGSLSYGVFMCLECSGKHRGLGVHISFVRSVTMDSWSEIQLKKMEVGGNERLNAFLAQYGVPKETDIAAKYNTSAAGVYRDRIQALAEGRPWRDPPIVKETLPPGEGGSAPRKPPPGQNSAKNDGWDSWDGEDFRSADIRRNQSVSDFRSGGGGSAWKKPPLGQNSAYNGGWDSWDGEDFRSADIRRNQSVSDFRCANGGGGRSGLQASRSKSTEDLYARAQLEASAANKDGFFARKMAENEARPEGIPPSQGGKYVGFGSAPAPSLQRKSSQGDILRDTVSVVSQGFGRLSLVAASAATVVQAGTKELTSKMLEGGYDQKVNETANVVTTKTTEIGQRTWGIMKGVMAMASQKVEEYTKEGANWHHSESERNGYYQEFGQENKGWGPGDHVSSGHNDSVHSWDDWGQEENKEDPVKVVQSGDSWVGWDDAKDESHDGYSNKSTARDGKPGSIRTEGGFR